MTNLNPTFAYFGGEPLGEPVLQTLLDAGFTPKLVVCNPDRPVGRKQVLTPPPVKVLAEQHGIEVWQPESVKDEAARAKLAPHTWDVFVVVAYNHILPTWLIELPKHKTLNVHPSLLPKFRGASPIRSAILADERTTGVSIMQLDDKLDHGPIVAQESLTIPETEWPLSGPELDRRLATLGGQLLTTTLPNYLAGTITPTEQNHEAATYTKKFTRADGELHLDPHQLPTGDEAYQTLLTIRALDGWPGTFFMHEGKRIKVTKAELAVGGELRLLRIIPEGKAEMDFSDYIID